MGRFSDANSRLVEVAVQLLQERSYGAVGVDAICRAAEVNKGSFYHFYKTKSDLAVAALDHAWQQFYDTILGPCFSSQHPPLERINSFFKMAAAQNCTAFEQSGRVNGCFFGSLGCELSGQDEKVRSKVVEIVTRIESCLQTSLEEASQNGSIADSDLKFLARSLLVSWQGLLLLAKIRNDPRILEDLPAIAQRLIQDSSTSHLHSSTSAKMHPSPQLISLSEPLDIID